MWLFLSLFFDSCFFLFQSNVCVALIYSDLSLNTPVFAAMFFFVSLFFFSFDSLPIDRLRLPWHRPTRLFGLLEHSGTPMAARVSLGELTGFAVYRWAFLESFLSYSLMVRPLFFLVRSHFSKKNLLFAQSCCCCCCCCCCCWTHLATRRSLFLPHTLRERERERVYFSYFFCGSANDRPLKSKMNKSAKQTNKQTNKQRQTTKLSSSRRQSEQRNLRCYDVTAIFFSFCFVWWFPAYGVHFQLLRGLNQKLLFVFFFFSSDGPPVCVVSAAFVISNTSCSLISWRSDEWNRKFSLLLLFFFCSFYRISFPRRVMARATG